MNISYFEQKQCFKIDTLHTSYMLTVVDSEGFLGHVYYGPYLPDLEEHCSVVVRPSGTEPKIKVYISVSAPDEASAVDREQLVAEDMKRRM